MGILMSFMRGGMPSTQVLNMVMGTLHKQFIEKDINNFDDFHVAILDIFNTFNSALPGKHYDVPSHKEIKACFTQWQNAEGSERKKVFVDFMKKRVSLSKVDETTIITGIVTPPAAMVVKRAGENVPQLKMIKSIPDVVFVPSVTVLALISVKITTKIIQGKIAS